MLTRKSGASAAAAPPGPTFTQSIGTLPPGKSVTIVFKATINALNTLPTGTSQVCNQGFVSATGISALGTDDPDVAGTNNPTCTPLNVADLAVTKTDSPDPASSRRPRFCLARRRCLR